VNTIPVNSQTAPSQLAVTIGTLRLRNPVMVASGTFGYGREYADFVDIGQLGAIVTKGLTLKPRLGNAPPRLAETPAGVLNSIGLQNVGLEKFLSDKLPYLRQFPVPVIVNILGETAAEYAALAKSLDSHVDALELNVSCPNVAKGGIDLGASPKRLQRLVAKVREATRLPLIVKLTPNVSDIVRLGKAAQEGGADALSAINTVHGLAVNFKQGQPVAMRGGLSGPAIKPIALRAVWDLYRGVSIPIIGAGGITQAQDAWEFLTVGASAIQVGTANFVQPTTAIDIIRDLQGMAAAQGSTSINDWIGLAHR